VAIDADVVAAALAGTWQHLARALPGAWVLRDGGAVAWVSGVGLPTLNGVWAERADPDPDAVTGLLDRVKATGLPYCLQLRPGASAALAELAAARAMGDFVGIFSIATPSAHRRHGYGAAVTVRAVADGLAAGARWSWLQSSPAGYATYTRLGFQTLETWPCWVAPS
jgi:hypothetical protein